MCNFWDCSCQLGLDLKRDESNTDIQIYIIWPQAFKHTRPEKKSNQEDCSAKIDFKAQKGLERINSSSCSDSSGIWRAHLGPSVCMNSPHWQQLTIIQPGHWPIRTGLPWLPAHTRALTSHLQQRPPTNGMEGEMEGGLGKMNRQRGEKKQWNTLNRPADD